MLIKQSVYSIIQKVGTCNPFTICKRLGIIVVFWPLGNETRGLIKKYKRSYIICINNELNEIDQLKTCAHELGHYILHKKINTLFMRTCTYLKTDKYEMEADSFADLLLNQLFSNC